MDMSEALTGLDNYLKCNGLPRVILDVCIKHLDDKSKSISQVQHMIYDLLDSRGIDEVKVTCFADEIIDWYICEIPETTINIFPICHTCCDRMQAFSHLLSA
jgi:hypothetical protein